MKPLIPYLFFNGNCRDAMNFYQQILGGKLEVMNFCDAPADADCGGNAIPAEGVMHACLTSGNLTLMASDAPGEGAKVGGNFSLSLVCDDTAEVDKQFAALSADGKITQQPERMFWGAYFSMLEDKFGISWMVSCA